MIVQHGYYKTVKDLLADGAWHRSSELFAAVIPLVTPEAAIRELRHSRVNLSAGLDVSVSRGRHRRIKRLLYQMRQKKIIESRGVGDDMEWMAL